MFDGKYGKLVKVKACLIPPRNKSENKLVRVDTKMVYPLLLLQMFILGIIGISRIYESGLFIFLSNFIMLTGLTTVLYIIILTHIPRKK